MHEPTIAELRTFLAVIEHGSFSSAARKLGRVQSAVSQTIATLEEGLGVKLFDRGTKRPTPTDAARVLAVSAHKVLSEVGALAERAASFSRGTEAVVSLCVDALFPLGHLVRACAAFAAEFPEVELRVATEALSAVTSRVLSGEATLGLVSPLGLTPKLERRALFTIRLVPCAAPSHPLARPRPGGEGPSVEELREHVQIVLSERSEDGVPDQGVHSPRTWRVGDLHTKRALMLAGLGWGNLPEPLIEEDLRKGRLVRVVPQVFRRHAMTLAMSAVYRRGPAFGPAHAWLVAKLEELGREPPIGPQSPKRPPRAVKTPPPKKKATRRTPP